MNTLFPNDVNPKHLRRGPLSKRSRKPALETLEGRSLLSANCSTALNVAEPQNATPPRAALVHSADRCSGSLTYSQEQGALTTSVAIATGGDGTGVRMQHTTVHSLNIGAPLNRALRRFSSGSFDGARVSTLSVVAESVDDDPPPEPEPAPPVSPINGPIQYPTLPPSGPLGPG